MLVNDESSFTEADAIREVPPLTHFKMNCNEKHITDSIKEVLLSLFYSKVTEGKRMP